MSRVPENMSFTHAEGVRWLTDLSERRDGVTVTSGAPARQIQSGQEAVGLG
jgi:hypothetical protein